MSKQNSRTEKLRRRAERDQRFLPRNQQEHARAVQGGDYGQVSDPLARAVLEAGRGVFPGGPASCQICGDDKQVGFYRWQKQNPDLIGQFCADCAGIQQQLYGDASGDTLLVVDVIDE